MKKAEEILRTYVDFEDVNGSEPVTLLPLTVIDAMEEYCQSEIDSLTKEVDATFHELEGYKEHVKQLLEEVERLRESLIMAKNYASNTNVIDAIDKVLTTSNH